MEYFTVLTGVSLSVYLYVFCYYLKLTLFLLCVMLISTLSLGFCAVALDEEYVSTCFWPYQRGGVLVVPGVAVTFSHGLLLLQYLYVSRL